MTPQEYAHMKEVTSRLYKDAIDIIDNVHGRGYAKRNPESVCAVVNFQKTLVEANKTKHQ